MDKEEGRDFLEFEGGPFDAILFVSSLHHIVPVEEALERAHRLLVPSGLLIAEEFDVEAADEPTARYWQGLKGKSGHALHEWRHHHAHHGVLASGAQMRAAVAARFTLREARSVPYLFRYLPDDADAGPVREEETRLIARGEIKPVGLRLLASR